MIELDGKLKVGDKVYPVLYVRATKRTSSARIRDGKVVIRLSRFLYGHHRQETIEKFLKWAQKRFANAGNVETVLPSYKDGGRVSTHNKIYEIHVNIESRKSVRAVLKDGYVVEISLPEFLDLTARKEKIRFLSEKIIMDDQLSYLGDTLDELNQMYFRARYANYKFKRVNSRFGSCSRKGNIYIAYRMLFAPRSVFKYVCLHELAHLKEFNHSGRFWALVSEAMLEYKDYEKWLRKNGCALG